MQSSGKLLNSIDGEVSGELLQEMDRELAQVRAQAAHVSFLQGHRSDAAASYSSLLLQNLQPDVALHAVCTNNSLCTQQHMDSLSKVCPIALNICPCMSCILL
jgi:hypothetical protein